MSAYVVVTLNPQNQDLLQEYSASAGSTIAEHQGVFLAKGPIEILHGSSEYSTQVIIQFPNTELAKRWYSSEEYQRLIPSRDQAMQSCFQLVG